MDNKETQLTSDEQKSLSNLKTALGDDAKGSTDGLLMRFLRSRSFDVEATATAFKACLAWRKEKKIDTIIEKPLARTEIMTKIFSYAYHGLDKQARPIYWEKTGKILVQALCDNVTVEEFVQIHIWGMEYMTHQCQLSSEKTGRPIDNFISVLDLEGLSLYHRLAIPYLKACMDEDYKYYPNGVGKVIVINSPWIMPTLYRLVQFVLDPITKERIDIVNGDYKQELLKYIDKEVIPVDYGGEAKNVFPVWTEEDLAPLMKSVNKYEGMDAENVPAGGKFQKVLEAGKEGGTFTWFFESLQNYDIDFFVQIVGEDGKETYAKIPSRCVTNKGSYTCTGPCKLIFGWDNSFSYIYSKDLRFFLAFAPEDGKSKQ